MKATIEPRQNSFGPRPSKPVVESSSLSSPTIPQPHSFDPHGLWFQSIEHPAESSVRIIPLTRQYVALVSSEDYERVSALKWCVNFPYPNHPYGYNWARGKGLYLHRFILNAPKGSIVDHINGCGLDCRRSNMRLATASQNVCNTRRKASGIGFIGVCSRTLNRFQGRVRLNRNYHYTTTFDSPVLAACARDVLAQRLHGEFAVLNFQFIPIPQGGGTL